MKFQVLDDKTVVEAGLSDHDVIIEGIYATFNLTSHLLYQNDSYTQSESLQHWQERLTNILPVMKEMYDVYGVRIFLLQGAPPNFHDGGKGHHKMMEAKIGKEFYANLQEMIPELDVQGSTYSKDWDPRKGAVLSDALFTIVDKQWSENLVNTTVEMRPFVSQENKNNFQSFEVHLEGSEPIKFANFYVHASSEEAIKADADYFTKNNYVVGGDFKSYDAIFMNHENVHPALLSIEEVLFHESVEIQMETASEGIMPRIPNVELVEVGTSTLEFL